MDTLDIEFPHSLEDIQLNLVGLFVIPTHLDQLMNLRNLSISGTTIKRAAIKFHTNSLETLNFSCNPIEEVLLLLPEGVTNLRLVTLSHNQILMISMECIGHNTKALNSNLYDLDEDQISSLISNFPKATQCLWDNEQNYPFRGENYLYSELGSEV